ncbi:MAG TPA: hypothetical protein VJV78_32390 [Polyangiales bacterium]|nr:hypothetical protein [Polyangiales bacterium]
MSREAFLASPLKSLTGYWLGVRCTARCDRTSLLPLKLLASKHGGGLALADAMARIRCELCKVPPSAVWITDYPVAAGGHGGQVATWSVVLFG